MDFLSYYFKLFLEKINPLTFRLQTYTHLVTLAIIIQFFISKSHKLH